MTDQEINVTIAEAVGRCPHTETEHYVCQGDSGFTCKKCGKDTYGDSCPDYCNNLNAMHEAEKYFDDKIVDVQSLYYDHLGLIVGWSAKTPNEARWEVAWKSFRASAHQRAEAFLKTIGKWKENS